MEKKSIECFGGNISQVVEGYQVTVKKSSLLVVINSNISMVLLNKTVRYASRVFPYLGYWNQQDLNIAEERQMKFYFSIVTSSMLSACLWLAYGGMT